MASLLHRVENSSAASCVQIHARVCLWYPQKAAAKWRGMAIGSASTGLSPGLAADWLNGPGQISSPF